MRTNCRSCFVFLALAFVVFCSLRGQAQTQSSPRGLSAEKQVARPGTQITIPITLNNASTDATGVLGNVNFELTYDPKVVTVLGDATRGEIIGSAAVFDARTEEAGRIRVGFANDNGITQNGTVAQIPFKIIGQPGQETELALKVIQARSKNQHQPLSLLTTNGRITIPAAAAQDGGHVSRDGVVTPMGYGQGGHLPPPSPTRAVANPSENLAPAQSHGGGSVGTSGQTGSASSNTAIPGVRGNRDRNGLCDLSGEWEYKRAVGVSKLTFTSRKEGGYDVQEVGMGQVVGVATVDGSKVRFEWRAYAGLGLDEYQIDDECSSGSGNTRFTTGENVGPGAAVEIRRLTVGSGSSSTASKPATQSTPSTTIAPTPAATTAPRSIPAETPPLLRESATTTSNSSAGADGCDLSGDWEVRAEGWMAGPWNFTAQAEGGYTVRQNSYADGNGVATLQGKRLRIEWRTSQHNSTLVFNLDALCNTGAGTMTVQADGSGDYASTIRRLTSATGLRTPVAASSSTQPAPAATAGRSTQPNRSGGPCGGMAGEWEEESPNGRTKWTFTPRKDGGYDTQQIGLGSVRGVAQLQGSRLHIDWQGYNFSGHSDYTLDVACSTANGKAVVDRGEIMGESPTTLRRRTVAAEINRPAAAPTPAASVPATPAPAVSATPPACDVSGEWEMKLNNTTSKLIFTPSGSGYDIQQIGLKGISGKATLQGTRLTFTYDSKGEVGTSEWEMDAACASGSGNLTLRKGAWGSGVFPHSIRRLSNASPAGKTGTSASAPASNTAEASEDQSLLGSWRACDGRVLEFRLENGEYVGRYTALGGLSVFKQGDIGYRAKSLSGGRYEGQVQHRWSDGRSEWRPNAITVSGNRYSDNSSDDCSREMTKMSSTDDQTAPVATTRATVAPSPFRSSRGEIPAELRNPDNTVRGDCDGDKILTAADARCAIQMSVGNRPVDLNLDLDRDGEVLSGDARLILEQARRMLDRNRKP